MKTLLVLSTMPDRASAETLAALLVELRLAACVTILAPCRSIYRWQGALETADEVPVLVKTTQACYDALEAAISAHHPYAIPEIIALPVTRGLPDYLSWVAAQCVGENVEEGAEESGAGA